MECLCLHETSFLILNQPTQAKTAAEWSCYLLNYECSVFCSDLKLKSETLIVNFVLRSGVPIHIRVNNFEVGCDNPCHCQQFTLQSDNGPSVQVRGGASRRAGEEHYPQAILLRHLEALLDLRRRHADDVGVGVGHAAVHVALVREEVARAPQQLDARLRLPREAQETAGRGREGARGCRRMWESVGARGAGGRFCLF